MLQSARTAVLEGKIVKNFVKSSVSLQRALLMLSVLLVGLGLSGAASAQLVFNFEEVGGDVIMTPSGSIDTALLQPADSSGWGGRGIEANVAPESDIMGDTTSGSTDSGFGFSGGTDFSAWETDTAPWVSSYFSWSGGVTTPFSTYVFNDDRDPGLQVRSSDLVSGVFTPSGSWTAISETFASIGLVPGTYTVTDATTGASITYLIGESVVVAPVPVPALSLWAFILLIASLGCMGYWRVRRTMV